jgi:hypothetical protein
LIGESQNSFQATKIESHHENKAESKEEEEKIEVDPPQYDKKGKLVGPFKVVRRSRRN